MTSKKHKSFLGSSIHRKVISRKKIFFHMPIFGYKGNVISSSNMTEFVWCSVNCSFMEGITTRYLESYIYYLKKYKRKKAKNINTFREISNIDTHIRLDLLKRKLKSDIKKA